MTLFLFLFRELKTHKIAFCTRVSAIFFYFRDFNVLYNPRKIMLIVKCGDFWREFYVKASGSAVKRSVGPKMNVV